MPNRLVVNSTKAAVTVNALTCPAESMKVLNITDAVDLPAWVGTAGIAVLASAADYQTRRLLARMMKYEKVQ